MGKLYDIRTGHEMVSPDLEAFEAAKAVLAADGMSIARTTPSSSLSVRPESLFADTPEVRITSVAGVIIMASLYHEIKVAQHQTPDEALSKVMFEELNRKLDTLNAVEQERAWEYAEDIFKTTYGA